MAHTTIRDNYRNHLELQTMAELHKSCRYTGTYVSCVESLPAIEVNTGVSAPVDEKTYDRIRFQYERDICKKNWFDLIRNDLYNGPSREDVRITAEVRPHFHVCTQMMVENQPPTQYTVSGQGVLLGIGRRVKPTKSSDDHRWLCLDFVNPDGLSRFNLLIAAPKDQDQVWIMDPGCLVGVEMLKRDGDGPLASSKPGNRSVMLAKIGERVELLFGNNGKRGYQMTITSEKVE